MIRQGISSVAVDSLTTALHITQGELASAFGIPNRTLARRKKEGTLNNEESAKLARLARMIERAEVVFEGLDVALNWLKSPNTALSGAVPLSLLDTDVGAETVLDTLGRFEHGVYRRKPISGHAGNVGTGRTAMGTICHHPGRHYPMT